jgi:hypothetical protein
MKIPTTYVTKQQLTDYVTKREFGDFVEEVRDFRASTEKRFDGIDRRFDRLEETIRIQNGALLEEFDHRLQVGLEFLQNEVKKSSDDAVEKFDSFKLEMRDLIREEFKAYNHNR